jgi:hypothetical protein
VQEGTHRAAAAEAARGLEVPAGVRSRALALSRGHARPWTLSLRPAPLAAGSAATAAGLGVSARAAAEAAAQEA